MNELDRLRYAYDAIDEPSKETIAMARALLLAEIAAGGEVSPSTNGRRRHEPSHRRPSRRRRWGLVALAAVVLVSGLLVTPALGLGSRLLDLIQDGHRPPEVVSPTWSPDGRRIAFVRTLRERRGLYVMNADGSGQRRLTSHTSWTPAWSPDGRKIAFDGDDGEVWVMNADGSGQRRLTHAGGWTAAWSPDGRTISFVNWSERGPGNPDVYVINADGSGERRLLQRALWHAWSPDGRKIAYQSLKDTVGVAESCSQVYVANADGTAERRLTLRPGRRIRWCYGFPVWSPDGRRIAMVRARAADRLGGSEVYVMNADGSGQRRLTRLVEAVFDLDWSPDGRKILFMSQLPNLADSGSEVYVVNADSSRRRNLIRNSGRIMNASWSPNGRKIVFVSDRSGSHEVYVMNADGSGLRRLTWRGE